MGSFLYSICAFMLGAIAAMLLQNEKYIKLQKQRLIEDKKWIEDLEKSFNR